MTSQARPNGEDTNDHGADDVTPQDATQATTQATAAEPAAEAAAPAAGSDDVAALRAEVADAKDKMLRAMAEAENTRRRSERTIDDTRKYAVSGFARDLLDVADNLRRALDAVPQGERQGSPLLDSLLAGVEATEKGLLQMLERHGIRKLEPREGKFDPNLHEVMFEAEGTGKPAGEIIQLLDAGYMIHDRLLRPARVGVAKGGAGEAHGLDQTV